MSDKIQKIKIDELPRSECIHDEDTFIESNDSETYKTSADDIAKYISENKHITEKYVQSDRIGESDGIAPLNSEKKLNGSYITYGTDTNTAYEGSSGKMLEQRLEAEKSRAISAETSAYQQAAEYTDQKFVDLKTVAFTGSYSDLSDQPAIPTKTSQLTNDSGYKTTDTKYTHPTTSGNKHIPSGGSSGQILRWSADGTAVWGADNNTTYSAATTSANGLMSAADKTKLDGIADGATANVPSETTPKAAGTAAVGTEETFARGDHVHPAQTSVSGNAGTATKLATARTIDGVSFNGTAAITHYGTCSTAAGTAAKVVACTGFTLVTGATIRVKFTVTNTAASPTLNVNSTGAKAVYYRGSAIKAGFLAANRTYEFVYNGAQYDLVGDNISDLETNMVSLKKSVSDGKSAVASAITAQGVTTAADASFQTMAENISSSGAKRYTEGVSATKVGTAETAQVLNGYTFTNSSTVGASGSMPNQGAWTGATTGNENVAIPAGYHNGSGYVSGSGAYNAGYNAGVAAGHKMLTGSFSIPKGSGGTIQCKDISFGSTFGTSVPKFGVDIRLSSDFNGSYSATTRYWVDSLTATSASIRFCASASFDCTATWVAAL